MKDENKNTVNDNQLVTMAAPTEQQANDIVKAAVAKHEVNVADMSKPLTGFDSASELASNRVKNKRGNRLYFITIGIMLSSIIVSAALNDIVVFGVIHFLVSLPLAIITDRKWPKSSWKAAQPALDSDNLGITILTWLGGFLILALAFYVHSLI